MYSSQGATCPRDDEDMLMKDKNTLRLWRIYKLTEVTEILTEFRSSKKDKDILTRDIDGRLILIKFKFMSMLQKIISSDVCLQLTFLEVVEINDGNNAITRGVLAPCLNWAI